MRLATIDLDGSRRVALINDDLSASVLGFLTACDAIAAQMEGVELSSTAPRTTVAAQDVRLLAPLPRPGKILGSGINYAGHQKENPAAVMPTEPGFFSKFPSSVVGPDTEVVIPAADSQVDYEVELAIVIGIPGRNITRGRAYEHIFGYTLINDISGRDIQFRPNQMDLGKGLDTFCPMGPWIVSTDEFNNIDDVRLRSRVNGELRQDASTAEWIYDVPALIEHASRYLTLEIGDLITTGTPAGCGTFRQPPLWLAPGDTITIEADGIGSLTNPVVAGW